MYTVIVQNCSGLINSCAVGGVVQVAQHIFPHPKLMTDPMWHRTIAEKKNHSALTLAHLARVARPTGAVKGFLAGPAGSAISARIYVAQLRKKQTTSARIINNVC